jgi:hypothetical protein
MRIVYFARRQLGRLMLLAGFLAAALLLTVGLLRFHSYDIHMWRGDYKLALKCMAIQEAPEDMESPLPPGLFSPPDDMEAAVKWYWRVTDSVVGDRTYAAFNHARRLYKDPDGRWEDALKALRLAYMMCCGRDGKVKPEYADLASTIKVMCGNAAYKSHPERTEEKQKKKLDEAVADYEEAIRLSPKNDEARYENERRKQNSGGGGGKGNNEPKPASSPNSNKKL